MQCKEWDDANSELFKESHDAAVQKNSYKGRLCELISASLKSGGNAKSQENPASTLLLSSGNAGSCCMWMVSMLLRWVIIFFTNLQNPFRFPISLSIHLYCISPSFLQPLLKRFSIPPHRHFDRSGVEKSSCRMGPVAGC